MTTTEQHKFEKAGLGLAPFRVVGNEQKTFQACPGAPMQVGGSCDYCGTGIIDTYYIESADGKKFQVGCECVRKTGDKGMMKVVNKNKATAAKAREKQRIEDMQGRLDGDGSLRGLLAEQPHPQSWLDKQGKTLLDSVEWMIANAGHAGKIKTVRLIEKLEKAEG